MTEAAKAKSAQRRQFMLEGPLAKVIFITAMPQVVTMLIDSLYNMADTFFVSQIGDAAMAAVGVNDSLMMLTRSLAMGFGMGSSSYISRALGAKKDETASRAATTTLFTAMGVIFVLFTVLGSIFINPLVDLLGATESVRPYSMEYARWILLSAPITAATVCLSQTLRAEGSTTFAMIGSVSGCIVNIVLDPLLINVFGLGVAGAAIATGISKAISMSILLMPFIKRQCVVTLAPRYFTPTKEIYSEIARMGIPTMLRSSMMSFATIITNNVAKTFGDVALASISVSNKSLKLVSSGIMGFSQGFQPIAGYSWGAKKYSRVLQAFKYTVAIGSTLGLVLGAGLFLFTDNVLMIFSDNPEVLALGRIFIRTQSIVLVPHVLTLICSGLFQALGKPVLAAISGLSRQLLSLIPSVLILSYFFGATGLACSQAASDIISFIISFCLAAPTLKSLATMKNEEPVVASVGDMAVAAHGE